MKLALQGPWEFMPGTDADDTKVVIRNFGGSTETKEIWFCLAPIDKNGKFAIGQDIVITMPEETYEAFAGSQSELVLGALQQIPAGLYGNDKAIDFSKFKIVEIVETKKDEE